MIEVSAEKAQGSLLKNVASLVKFFKKKKFMIFNLFSGIKNYYCYHTFIFYIGEIHSYRHVSINFTYTWYILGFLGSFFIRIFGGTESNKLLAG